LEDITELLGSRIVIKDASFKVAFNVITLEKGQEIQILSVDDDLDRALIEYPCGKLDWKRTFWIKEHSTKKL
jgi:hypothetical protein